MGETISEAIGADHDTFDVLYENIKNATDDGAKVRWRNQLTWTIARHAISEELTLYPAMEKHLGEEGVLLSKTDKEQHQGVRRIFFSPSKTLLFPIIHACPHAPLDPTQYPPTNADQPDSETREKRESKPENRTQTRIQALR